MLLLLSTVAFAADEVVDRVAAVVRDDVIALSEIQDAVDPSFFDTQCAGDATCQRELEHQVLDELIRSALIRQELVRLQIDVTTEQVDRQIDAIWREQGHADRSSFRDFVENEGLRWSNYRRLIRNDLRTQMFRSRVLFARVSIHEDELRDAYQRISRDSKVDVARITAVGMAGGGELSPGDLVDRVRKGELTWQGALDEFDSAQLNDRWAPLEWARGSLLAPLDEAIFAAKEGDILDPIEVNDLWVVVRVESRGQSVDIEPFEDVRDQLQARLTDTKLQEIEAAWYARARRETAVKVLLEPTP